MTRRTKTYLPDLPAALEPELSRGPVTLWQGLNQPTPLVPISPSRHQNSYAPPMSYYDPEPKEYDRTPTVRSSPLPPICGNQAISGKHLFLIDSGCFWGGLENGVTRYDIVRDALCIIWDVIKHEAHLGAYTSRVLPLTHPRELGERCRDVPISGTSDARCAFEYANSIGANCIHILRSFEFGSQKSGDVIKAASQSRTKTNIYLVGSAENVDALNSLSDGSVSIFNIVTMHGMCLALSRTIGFSLHTSPGCIENSQPARQISSRSLSTNDARLWLDQQRALAVPDALRAIPDRRRVR